MAPAADFHDLEPGQQLAVLCGMASMRWWPLAVNRPNAEGDAGDAEHTAVKPHRGGGWAGVTAAQGVWLARQLKEVVRATARARRGVQSVLAKQAQADAAGGPTYGDGHGP